MTNINLYVPPAPFSTAFGPVLGPVKPRSLVPVPFKSYVIMPGGEPYVELDVTTLTDRPVLVDARIGDMNDFGLLMATLDALRRLPLDGLYLFIPYFPGARGDRVNDGDGTALAAAMYAKVINSYHPDRVFIVDPHSDVTPALINNVTVFTAADLLPLLMAVTADRAFGPWDAFICPDQGAEKRTAVAAKALGIDRIINARKIRDRRTGALTGIEVDLPQPHVWNPPNPRLLIVDDICDGGGTFVGLAEQLRDLLDSEDGADADGVHSTIDLFCTHGIFSKGTNALNGIDHLFCTDAHPGWGFGNLGDRPIDAVLTLDRLYPQILTRFLPR